MNNPVNCKTDYVSWPVKTIVEKVKMGTIYLDPPYQRAPVWSNALKMGLVNSILMGYPIPSILLLEKYTCGKKIYVCIDGKQRCCAIRDFINDKFKIKIDGNTLNYSLMADDMKLEFSNHMLSVAIIEGLREDEECKVFERINRSVALSSGELVETYLTSPLLKARDAMFSDNSVERKTLEKYWGALKNRDKDKRKKVSVNLLSIVCGLAIGEEFITKSFPKLQAPLETIDDEAWSKHDQTFKENTAILLRCWKKIEDTKIVLPESWKRGNRMWTVGFIIGYQIYSIRKIGQEVVKDCKMTEPMLIDIWVKFIRLIATDTTFYDQWQFAIGCKSNNINTKRLRSGWELIKSFYEQNTVEVFNANPKYDDFSDDSSDE
jgi:hypothetical protein